MKRKGYEYFKTRARVFSDTQEVSDGLDGECEGQGYYAMEAIEHMEGQHELIKELIDEIYKLENNAKYDHTWKGSHES